MNGVGASAAGRLDITCSTVSGSGAGDLPGSRGRLSEEGHRLLRAVLGSLLEVPPRDLVFGRRPCPVCGGARGRPFLPARPQVEFSLAHTRGLVAVAVYDGPVGVDVEAADRVPGRGVVDALHPTERAEIAALPAAERRRATLRCWVRKEAVLKAAGQGLGHGLDEPYVGAGPMPAGSPWVVRDLDQGGGFLAAVATRSAPRTVRITAAPGS